MVCALGRESDLVGRSHECDYPASIRKLSVCTESIIDSDASSAEIDKNVKTHLKNGLSLFKIKEDLLNQLKPDIVLTQSHCDVCAVSTKDVEKKLGKTWGKDVAVVSLGGTTMADIWNDMARVAKKLGVPDGGESVIKRFKQQMADVAAKARASDERPRVACIEWLDPLMIAGNWVPELVEMAGGVDVLGRAGEHSDWIGWERIVEKDPDIIVVMPCGFGINRARKEMGPLLKKPEWLALQAVNNNRVFIVDGNQYFNRPGPRLVESMEILAEIFHPEMFDFGQKMTGWQYL
jgi:iron complex transport system substrate-binding protein